MVCSVKRSYKIIKKPANAMDNKLFQLGNADYQLPPRMYQIRPRHRWRWGRFSLNTSVSLANLYSTKFSIITIT
jgi:hypothetical protein